jgi:hypothetical protein
MVLALAMAFGLLIVIHITQVSELESIIAVIGLENISQRHRFAVQNLEHTTALSSSLSTRKKANGN